MESLGAEVAYLRVDKRSDSGSGTGKDGGVHFGVKMSQVDTARSAGSGSPRLVVAHFMLGNTYDFNDETWLQTFEEVAATGLDGLALNLGPEDWQFAQARSAFHVLAQSPFSCSSSSSARQGKRPLQLFISMDMNVLPSTTPEEAQVLKDKVLALLRLEDGISPIVVGPNAQAGCAEEGENEGGGEGEHAADLGRLYLRWGGRKVLSTFSGHAAELGGQGWTGWLRSLERELGEEVCFWPSFFLPPSELTSLPFARGHFTWNAAWPLSSPTPESLSLRHTDPLLYAPFSDSPSPLHPDSDDSTATTGTMANKAYMTSVSPCFYTHYASPGTTPSGAWEWGKNWVYASDDLMMVRRWEKLLELDREAEAGAGAGLRGGRNPDIIQVISWNDYGESHYICPTVLGCQPGSEAWVDGMPHKAFAEMTRWMVGRWRDGMGEVDMLYQDAGNRSAPQSDGKDGEATSSAEGVRAKVWMWYRVHPAAATASDDERGKPEHVDRAKDLINVVALLPHEAPPTERQFVLVLNNGQHHSIDLQPGRANAFTIPFVPGPVNISIRTRQKGQGEEGGGQLVWQAEGGEIEAEPGTWNYNFWSWGWDVDLQSTAQERRN